MAPKSKRQDPSTPSKSKPTEPKTIGAKLRADYLASRPLQVLLESKGWGGLTPAEKTSYANFKLLESEAYVGWSVAQQRDFLRLCETQKIPFPLPEPKSLGVDSAGKKIEDYTMEEYKHWKNDQLELNRLQEESISFRECNKREKAIERPNLRSNSLQGQGVGKREQLPASDLVGKMEDLAIDDLVITEEDYQAEKQRRTRIAELEGGNMPGIYEGDPEWDDVVPIPQDDGEKPLAAIAYTAEYSEAISYLRAVMASKEYSPRVLELTSHIIDMNPAHYSVWLYRASTLFALNSNLSTELDWVNSVALSNQKNYQIWHHRQVLIDNIYPTISTSREEVLSLARSETAFMAEMFHLDSKNYHVWSYRQYLVHKLSLFPSQSSDPSELSTVEGLIAEDVRNNSAWSHRFFIVFSDPGYCTEGSKATERDEKIPSKIVDREVEFSKVEIRRAGMNQSGWNYLRGVLRKGGRELSSLEDFAREFVKLEEEEVEVKSSHALELLADAWAERGEAIKADFALKLLSEKYDVIRRNYWEWRRETLSEKKENISA